MNHSVSRVYPWQKGFDAQAPASHFTCEDEDIEEDYEDEDPPQLIPYPSCSVWEATLDRL
jgi:hypothetical protein